MTGNELLRKAAARLLALPLVLGAVFFASAGTLSYWQAWVYMTVLFVPMSVAITFFATRHPELLERRLAVREKERPQQLIVALSFVVFVIAFVLPGLDRRFGWSAVPTALVAVGDGLVLAGYLFMLGVLRENAYASRVIRVEEGQTVISTGPYARIRHPMYAGMIVLYLGSPLALGSYWALPPCLLLGALLVPRILNEEKVLTAELEGYAEYKSRVRYRLIPGLW